MHTGYVVPSSVHKGVVLRVVHDTA